VIKEILISTKEVYRVNSFLKYKHLRRFHCGVQQLPGKPGSRINDQASNLD